MIPSPIDAAIRRTEPARILSGTVGPGIEPSRPGEVRGFRWVPDETIPEDHRAYVAELAERASAVLGLPPVRVRYFEPAAVVPELEAACDCGGRHRLEVEVRNADGSLDARHVLGPDFYGVDEHGGTIETGVTPPGQSAVIGIPASLRGSLLVAAVAHECRHAAHNLMRARLSDPAYLEADASAFGRAFAAKELQPCE